MIDPDTLNMAQMVNENNARAKMECHYNGVPIYSYSFGHAHLADELHNKRQAAIERAVRNMLYAHPLSVLPVYKMNMLPEWWISCVRSDFRRIMWESSHRSAVFDPCGGSD